MDIKDSILGNAFDAEWKERLKGAQVDWLELSQWDAQKNRFRRDTQKGRPLAVALERGRTLRDGDILEWDEARRCAVICRIRLCPVMAVDMHGLSARPMEEALGMAVRLGHALGNQHWPAVVKDTMVYVPVSIGTDVAASVMDTHAILGTSYAFLAGEDVLSLLDEQEVRRLFGGAERPESGHSHHHCFHDFDHDAFLAREGFANLQGCAEQGTGEGHPLRMREPGPHGRRHRGRRHGHYDER